MPLDGIGGGDAGSALERFQRIRDSARKKLEGADRQANLADLVRRKQSELGAGSGVASRSPADRVAPGPALTQGAQAGGAQPAAAYGRAGGLEKPDPKPRLGRFVDFMA
jgi:hypothetical protein